MDISSIVQTIAVYAIPLIFAITIHETAHGYVAKLCGDQTAYMLGRLTLNPIKHIDPVGTILIRLYSQFSSYGCTADRQCADRHERYRVRMGKARADQFP